MIDDLQVLIVLEKITNMFILVAAALMSTGLFQQGMCIPCMERVPFLDSNTIQNSIDFSQAVSAVRDGYRQRGNGAPAEPRTLLHHEQPAGIFTGYFAILPETSVMGMYVYSGGFESGEAWFLFGLYDAVEGTPLGIFDGASLNPYKTGATGAVGVDALARSNSSTVGIIGSGPQAYAQIHATAVVRDIECVSVYSPTKAHREAFAEHVNGELSATVQAVDSVAAATIDSDVVITATRSRTPVVDFDHISPGTHITAMGQYGALKRELDAKTVSESVYVPDLRSRIEYDAGSYIQAIEAGKIEPDHIHGELGEVITGTVPGRQSPEQITVFDSGGTAIETTAVAAHVNDQVSDADIDIELPFISSTEAFGLDYR